MAYAMTASGYRVEDFDRLRNELGIAHLELDPWGSLIVSPATDEHESAVAVLHDQAVRQLAPLAGCVRSNGLAWKTPGSSGTSTSPTWPSSPQGGHEPSTFTSPPQTTLERSKKALRIVFGSKRYTRGSRMPLTSRRLLLVVGLLATVLGGTAAGAYGCVPQPFIVVNPQASAAAGTEVKVDGQLFPNGSKVEIRWNATDGPLLATTQSADFSVPITIPSAPAGLYTVLALSRSQAGVQGEVARAAFQVTGAASAPPPTASPPEAGAEPTSSGGGTSFVSVAAAVGLVALGLVAGALIFGRRSKGATGSPTSTAAGGGEHQPPTE